MEGKIRINFLKICVLFVFYILIGYVKGADEEPMKFTLMMPDVQPMMHDSYLCTAYKMPRRDFQYIVGFTPNASMHTAHHILIYGCDIPGQWERDSPRLVWDCGEMNGRKSKYLSGPTCSSGTEIIYAWAKDAPALVLPEGVAFKVGKGTGIRYLVLQVHYGNIDKFLNGGTDNSGIILSILPSTSKKVTKTAGIFLLGTDGTVPAGAEEHMESACRIDESVVIHPFAFRTHTHALGKLVTAYKIDKEGNWHLIGKHNPQEPQMFYPVENDKMTIEYGDVLASRCTMFNFRDRDTHVGSTADDEMCNFYMMYYVDGDKLMREKYCFSNGPPLYYWEQDPKVGYVPNIINKDASTPN